jgi:hypothetical protein
MTATKLEGPIGRQEFCDVLPTAEQISQTALGTPEGFLVDQRYGDVAANRVANVMMDTVTPTIAMRLPTRFVPQPAYESYQQMDKVLARRESIDDLVSVYESLKDEELPKYLAVAGWAAAEAAIMGTQLSSETRHRLLDGARGTWLQALVNQLGVNNTYPYMRRAALPYRYGLDLASLPLLRGMVDGCVTEIQCEESFRSTLQIARLNREQRLSLREEGDFEAAKDHGGFSFELLCILAINRNLSPSKFALPAFARADSGYHWSDQCHDVLSIHQNWGVVRNAVPIEVKQRTKQIDRNRFKALLMRGDTYLRSGTLTADETLDVFDRAYTLRGPEDIAAADAITDQVVGMIKEYSRGQVIDMHTRRSVTHFRDDAGVLELFPGLQRGVGRRALGYF